MGVKLESLTMREKYRLKLTENRFLRKIFGPKRDEVIQNWRILCSKEVYDLYS
jgi:hypothetical protein